MLLDFTNLPFVDDGDCDRELVSKRGGFDWDSRYRDLFAGRPDPPPKLPEEFRARFTTGGRETAIRHFITGSDLRRWMNTPGSSLRVRERPVLNT